MKYLLDTNTCIRYLNRRSPNIIQKLSNLSREDIAVCSVVKAQLFYGAMRSQQPQRTLERQREFLDYFVSLPFADRAAEHYAAIRAQLETAGTPIGPNDLMIAAIARANRLILVSTHTREFSRIQTLTTENWDLVT